MNYSILKSSEEFYMSYIKRPFFDAQSFEIWTWIKPFLAILFTRALEEHLERTELELISDFASYKIVY